MTGLVLRGILSIFLYAIRLFKIPTALHSLVRLRSVELAYITKRFDRIKNNKLAMEDMCQLTGTLTTDKYRSSMEKAGKQITAFSSRPGFDAITFFETVLLAFLTGYADMHLKNFSLLTTAGNDIVLSPAYDLVCTKIAMPGDKEETGLTINAKKRKLKKADFDSLGTNLKIPERAMENSYKKFAAKLTEANKLVDISFLLIEMKQQYKELIMLNAGKPGLL